MFHSYVSLPEGIPYILSHFKWISSVEKFPKSPNIIHSAHLVDDEIYEPLIFPSFFRQTLSWLVVEPYPSDEYEFVNWDDEILNIFHHFS